MAKFVIALLGVWLLPLGQERFAQGEPSVVPSGAAPSPKGTGRITGRVMVAGNYREPKSLPVFKNRSFCGARIPNETLLVGRNGGLRNAVVTLHAFDRTVAPQPTPLVLDNRRCAFEPHVQVAAVGSELLLKNSDPILHTVHARLGKDTLFNVGLPTWRQVTKRLDRIGVVRIECDVLHTWMSAAIVVTDTPYFAVSDENGIFLIEHLLPGQYRTEIWHEKLGTKTIGVAVDGNKGVSLDVVYAASGK